MVQILILCRWDYAVPDIRSILRNMKIHVPVFLSDFIPAKSVASKNYVGDEIYILRHDRYSQQYLINYKI